MRKCKVCKETKPSSSFYKDVRVKKDGLRSRCISCLTTGNPNGPLPVSPLDRYNIDSNGCWIWTGAIHKTGYGQVKWKGKSTVAHRVIYELLSSDIPSGLVLDHLCNVKKCVNPEHLEPVTYSENTQRAWNRNHCKTCTCEAK